jgi:hypothetical protein
MRLLAKLDDANGWLSSLLQSLRFGREVGTSSASSTNFNTNPQKMEELSL